MSLQISSNLKKCKWHYLFLSMLLQIVFSLDLILLVMTLGLSQPSILWAVVKLARNFQVAWPSSFFKPNTNVPSSIMLERKSGLQKMALFLDQSSVQVYIVVTNIGSRLSSVHFQHLQQIPTPLVKSKPYAEPQPAAKSKPKAKPKPAANSQPAAKSKIRCVPQLSYSAVQPQGPAF